MTEAGLAAIARYYKLRSCTPLLFCVKCTQSHQEVLDSPGVLSLHLSTVTRKQLVECVTCQLALPRPQLAKHKADQHPDLSPQEDALAADSKVGSTIICFINSVLYSPCVVQTAVASVLVPCDECSALSGASKKVKMIHYRDRHPAHHASLLRHNAETWRQAPSSQYTQCDICNKNIRRCNLKEHKLHSHAMDLTNQPVERPTYNCDICGHISKYAKDLKKHKRTVHEKILRFACKFCGKKFSNSGNLNQHEVSCSGLLVFMRRRNLSCSDI